MKAYKTLIFLIFFISISSHAFFISESIEPELENKKIEASKDLQLAPKKSLQVFAGAITYHFFDFEEDARKFKKNIGDQGKLISHPFFGYELSERTIENQSKFHAAFVFNDSIGSLAFGLLKGLQYNLHPNFDFGYLYGVYMVKQDNWERAKIELPVRIKIGRYNALVPILGLRQTIKFNITKDYQFKINSVILPNTMTLFLGISKDF